MFDLERLIYDLGIKKGEFAEIVGRGYTAVSNNISRRSIPQEWLEIIKNKFPHVNITDYELENSNMDTDKNKVNLEQTVIDLVKSNALIVESNRKLIETNSFLTETLVKKLIDI